MRRIPFGLVVAVFVVSLGLVAACEGDAGGGGDTAGGGGGGDTAGGGGDTPGGGGDTAGGGGEVGQSYTASLTAAEGGTLQTPSGAAQLEVPAGALAADTELSVTVAAKTADTASDIYDFGPDGLQFEAPVTLTILWDGDPGEGNKAVIAWKDGETWTEIAGSSLTDGKVTAPVEHFSQFAVVVTAAGVEQQGACGELADSFEACGGALEGTWTIETICLWFDPEEGPFGGDEGPFGDCPEAVYALSFDWVGTYTVDATTIHTSVSRIETHTTVEVPNACFPAGMTCAQMAEDMDELDCAAAGDVCRCTGDEVQEEQQESDQTYTIEGNVLVVQNSEGGESTRLEYCVEGDKATFRSTETERSGGDIDWIVLQRQ